ncbi:LysR family transcriptional regulator [Brevibacterium sp. FAM 25378]|uniref:LysR family transcriptional regulator n=1 Tax=unclassified Brevibacterium TaxID=2614124 RepID=UPI001091C5D4|nr:LysR family transcriptional regulator [Brevibacterium sp. S22]TGD30768.1 LysR family transcriptional regulator [Brevibacterium sp. S22]
MRVQRTRYFLAAVDTGSFRAAASQCEISQPALREQVTLLEEELNVVLLVRSRFGVHPTAAAESLIPYFTRLIAAEEAVHRMAAELSDVYRGRVTIGSIATLAEALLAPVTSRLLSQHPKLRFEISETSSTEIETAVLAGDFDIGVITSPRTRAIGGVTRTRIASASLGILVPDHHVLAERRTVEWQDLEMWPIVTMRPGTVVGQEVADRLPSAEVVVRAASGRTVKVMVQKGAGVGVLAAVDLPGLDTSLRWIPLLDTPPLEICLVHRSDSQPSASALIVRRFLEEQSLALFAS